MSWLKEIRLEQGMTGGRVGEAVKITPQYYNFIENGKRRPSVEVAKRIAVVLGFPWTRFYEDEETAARPGGRALHDGETAGGAGTRPYKDGDMESA